MAQPTITPAEEPTEWRILEAARAMLEAAIGSDYVYDSDGAYVVVRPQIKHLAETDTPFAAWGKTLYLVSPGDWLAEDYTQCATNYPGDFLVTGCVRIGTPELPWLSGYVPIPQVQLRIAQDIRKVLHLKQVDDAILKVENRNLNIEVDGWAIAQVQVAFEYSEIDA